MEFDNKNNKSRFADSKTFRFISILFAPEVLFAFCLMPTRLAFLSSKFHLPYYVNPVNFIALIVLIIVIYRLSIKKNLVSVPVVLSVSYLALCVVAVVSISFTTNTEYGLEKTSELISLDALCCFAPLFLFQQIKYWERFLKAIIYLSVFLSIFIFISSPYSFYFYSSFRSYPKFATMLGGNYLALQYTVSIGLLSTFYYFLFKKKSFRKNILLLVCAGLFAAALLYSPGKGPILSIIITFLFITLSSFKVGYKQLLFNRKMFRTAIFIFGIGTLIMLTIGWNFILRLNAILKPGYYGHVERVANTDIAMNLFWNNPLEGRGIGSFSTLSAQIPGIDRMVYPHNLLLELASELGFAGLFFFVLLLGAAFIKLFSLKKKYRYTPYYHLPVVILSFLIFNFLAALTGGNINNAMLFAWIGCSFAIEPMIKMSERNSLQ